MTSSRDRDFKRIAFDLAGDRTEKGEADSGVISERGDNNGGAAACLRSQVDPDGIAAAGNITRLYHSSFPSKGPVSHS